MFLPSALSRACFRADDLVRHGGVWRLYRTLLETERWPRDRIEALRAEKLRRLVTRAATASPYWERVFRSKGLLADDVRSTSDLAALPPLTREDLREHHDTILVRGADGVLPNSTGGSTGSNVRFGVDRNCWQWRDAASLRKWNTMGLAPGAPVVQIWGAPMDATQGLRQRVRFVLDNRRVLSAFALDDQGLKQIAVEIARTKPRAVMGYASVLDLLASKVSSGAIPWDPLPGLVVISASETLFPEQRRNIAKALGARVVNLYGCREFGLIAVECHEGGMHLNEERLIVELVPEPHGQGARLQITDLDNLAFPFLKYEIGDLADADETSACACGRTLRRLAAVRGRIFDVIQGPSGQAVGGTFWSLLLRTAVSGIETWQVAQVERDRLEIRSTPRGGLSESGRETVRREVQKALGENMRVEFRDVDRLETLASGKHRVVIGLNGKGGPVRERT